MTNRQTHADSHRKARIETRYEKLPKTTMSSWYSIFDLFRTVVDISITEVFRARIDHRTLQALEQPREQRAIGSLVNEVPSIPESASTAQSVEKKEFVAHPKYFDYSGSTDKDFWFDFAADVGDGFNSTYYVAALMSQPKLSLLESDPKPFPGDRATDRSHQRTGGPEGKHLEEKLPRGRFLLLGGDEVYPSASRESYENKFIRVYEAASYSEKAPDKNSATHLYALPGNHDWYDGLASFMAIFADQRAIGQFRTQQRSSYFAIKLPHGFWIFAVDIGLSGELDRRQVEHFQDLAENHLKDSDRIILCIAEPDWVKARPNIENLRDGLFYFERKLAEALKTKPPQGSNGSAAPDGRASRRDVRVVLRLAGDLHHYRRHTSHEPYHPSDEEVQQDCFEPRNHRTVQNITAGGGGAFLHPTHEVDEDRRDRGQLKEGSIRQFPPGLFQEGKSENSSDATTESRKGLRFDFQLAFPSIAESRRITFRNFAFGHYNGKMTVSLWILYGLLFNLGLFLLSLNQRVWIGLLLAAVSTLFVVATRSYAQSEASGEIGESKQGRARTVYHSRNRIQKAGWSGAVHGVSHALCFGTAYAGLVVVYLHMMLTVRSQKWPFLPDSTLLEWTISPDFGSVSRFLLSASAGFACAVLSTVIFGLYLYFALNCSKLRLHANGAFASLRIEDYKNFLRLRITEDGITVYPIGIREVPKKWQLEIPESKRRKDGLDEKEAAQKSLFYPVAKDDNRTDSEEYWYNRLTKSVPLSEPFLIEDPLFIPKKDPR